MDSKSVLFCVVVKDKVCRSKSGKLVVGPFALMKRALKVYNRGAKLVRYHSGMEAHTAK